MGAAKRGVHLVGVVEEGVVDLVGEALFAVVDHGLEAVSPEEFGGQVRGPSLGRLSRRLDRPFQGDDDLELVRQELRRAHRVQGTLPVDPVDHHRRPQQEHVRIVLVYRQLELAEERSEDFTLLRDPRPHQERAYGGGD